MYDNKLSFLIQEIGKSKSIDLKPKPTDSITPQPCKNKSFSFYYYVLNVKKNNSKIEWACPVQCPNRVDEVSVKKKKSNTFLRARHV